MIQSTRYKKGNPVMYNGVQMFVYMGSQHPKYILSEIEDLNEVTSDKLHEAFLSDLKPCKQFGGSSIKSKAKVKSKAELAQEVAQRLWFEMQMNKIPEFCQECGLPLRANLYSRFEQKCCIAHVLAKNIKAFPELATHPDNCIYLCAKNGCHGRFDNLGADVRSKMKVYPIALEKFEKMKKKLSESQLIKAKIYLNLK